MSLSGHHLLASPAPSSIGSVPHGSSPPSPAINGGFNCLCINNMSAAPGGEGRGGGASMQEGQDHFSLPTPPLLDSPPTSERITSLRLSEPVPETSNAIAPAQQCLTSAQSRPRPSQSGSSSRLDFSNPTLERFELFEPWDPRFSSKPPCDPPQPSSTSPDMDGAGSDPEGAAGAKSKCKPRTIYINNPSRTCNSSSDICGNKVRTSKYTLLTFLPKNLFEQFRRVAYIYFLAIVILNQIPQLAVFGRTASLFPLLFVLVVTAIKDGYEDWGRHRSDIIENNRLAKVYIQGAFRFKKWKHIQVGEVVKVDANTPVPCDMVLLGTSNSSGVAYIQTLNLDGESNLKTRYANQETHMTQLDTNSPVSGVLDCEPPTRNIYEFSGVMRLENVEISLVPSNVILRGCEVKNTAWVVGVVVYAGKDTKVMMNSSGAQSKRSKLESQMNSATMWLAVFLLVICMIGGMGMGLWVARHENILDSLAYYHKLDLSTGENVEFYNAAGEAIFALLSFVIMFQVMIPISLYISMELVRLGQSTLMSRDTEMYHDDKGFECRALNINEDLGQIKYIFSDKTGTLTQNKMEFYTASVDGVDYNNAVAFCSLSEESSQSDDIQPWPIQPVKVDPKLLRLAQSSEKNSIENFFLVLAICNTVVPITVDRKKFVKNVEASMVHLPHASAHLIDYQAESPDEQALVSAAAAYGYALLERTSRSVKVAIHGKPQRYELLGLHEFDSVRKRMSVVVRCPDQSIKLLLKGADAVVLDLLTKGLLDNAKYEVDTHQKHVLVSTHEHLDKYAKEGLRTLVIASKDLSQAEFQNWEKQYRSASKELGSVRVAWLRRVAETLEDNLTLLGATGIEDKLQDGVPETIAALREAGMKVWVLTGDKQETAISIGFSCNLLMHDMELITVNATTPIGCQDAFRKAFETINRRKASSLTINEESMPSTPLSNTASLASLLLEDGDRSREIVGSRSKARQPLALIIDGNSLVHALKKEFEQELFDIATACQVVICCRVAPSQKANIVSLVKEKAQDMTLAIGDGANDVPMLQKAHVGVGISGQEGRQAVMSSDFSMGQFKFLRKLLLVHGHWNYQRLSYMVLYNFYRNAVFVMMLFWYILQTAFSASSAVFDWNLMFYSLIYTSIPTVVVGILDKDIDQDALLNYPPLYGAGQRDENYNNLLFWITMLDTLWQSLVLFYVPFFTFQVSTIDVYSLGSLWTIAVVVLVSLHLAMDIHQWTWITHVAIWGSILATFGCLFVLDSVTLESFLSHYGVIYKMIASINYWYDIALIVVFALLPRFCVKVVMQRKWPSDVQIIREAELNQA